MARQTAANTPGDRHPLTARIALALARTRLMLGNPDSALANVSDALAVALRAGGPAHPFTAECYMTKGCIEEAVNKIPAAFESYRKAIAVYKEATKENFTILPEKGRPTFHVGDLARRRLPVEGGQPKTLMAFAILDHRHYFPSIRGNAVGQSGLSVG